MFVNGNNAGSWELLDEELDGVVGGVGISVTETAVPLPTGTTAYRCPVCHTAIDASTRDATVVCPNVNCGRRFTASNGRLVPLVQHL